MRSDSILHQQLIDIGRRRIQRNKPFDEIAMGWKSPTDPPPSSVS
jgi:hypothetical protein